MEKVKVVFFIDKIEFQYFEFNQLVTSFWLIKECNLRGWEVFISTSDKLWLKDNQPQASLFRTKLKKFDDKMDLVKEKVSKDYCLNDMDIVFFRPDPPVDINYINSTYLLDFVDETKTLVVNSASGIRKANEKIYINNFPQVVPTNIITQNISLIKEFLNEYSEIIVKPLNKCFGKGVFYIKKGDKNTNSILEAATDFGKNPVMSQQFIKNIDSGDKRVNIICGNIIEEAIIKLSGEGDFKFNSHNDKYFAKANLTDKEKEICTQIAPKLMQDGLYLVGLDFIQGKIIEINVTSPCFFIKEINNMFNVQLEKTIIDQVQNLYYSKRRNISLVS